MANVITLDMLIRKKACSKQVELFKQYFGESVEITEEICIKYSNEFYIDCLAAKMLNEEQLKAYKAIRDPAYEEHKATDVRAALEAYEAIEGPAWKKYSAIHGLARKNYEAIGKPAWKDYKAIVELAYEDYKAIKAHADEAYDAIVYPAYKAYNKEQARAFFIAYNS